MILPTVRDPRLVTIRRGGTLTDADHQAFALWAATCAERVLPLFEAEQPGDDRPRSAIAHVRGWVRGEVPMMVSRAAGGHAMGAARPLRGPARFAAYAAGQAACVAEGLAGAGTGQQRSVRSGPAWSRHPPHVERPDMQLGSAGPRPVRVSCSARARGTLR